MSPEQAAGEREIDGRSDVYSLGIVAYQMVTGELPFQAPTVAGILMKQITEPAPMVTLKRPDVPEDLALAISRCLEKDPENRWPTADASAAGAGNPHRHGLPADRNRLESRSYGGTAHYPAERHLRAATAPARRIACRRDGANGAVRQTASRRATPGPARDSEQDDKNRPPVDTGEPEIVQKTRAIFARWAAVGGGCFLINLATGIGNPWCLFVLGGMGIPLLRSYATLWQSGYSWRDVLSRPAAHDSAETKLTTSGGKLPRLLPAPTAADYGMSLPQIQQLYRDRVAILGLMERLPASDKKMLPEVVQTADALFARATDLAKTLHAMDANLETGGFTRVEERIAAIMREPDDEERARRIGLLERQKNQLAELRSRRDQVAANLESCILAMQNVRFDLLRLKSAGRRGGAGRSDERHPAGPGAQPRRGRSHRRGERSQGSDRALEGGDDAETQAAVVEADIAGEVAGGGASALGGDIHRHVVVEPARPDSPPVREVILRICIRLENRNIVPVDSPSDTPGIAPDVPAIAQPPLTEGAEGAGGHGYRLVNADRPAGTVRSGTTISRPIKFEVEEDRPESDLQADVVLLGGEDRVLERQIGIVGADLGVRVDLAGHGVVADDQRVGETAASALVDELVA